MAHEIKMVSVRLLRELIAQEEETINSEDPYQLYLFIWSRFTCAECGRDSDFYVREDVRPKTPIVLTATEKARTQGWSLAQPSDVFLSSEAYCPACAGKKLPQTDKRELLPFSDGQIVA